MLWSEIEERYVGVLKNPPEHIPRYHPDCAKYQLLIAQQEKHLRGFSSHYYFRGGIHRAAEQQVGAYAGEGAVLENVYPNAILLQSEWPWQEKDPLYQWLRVLLGKKPLAIIHPFPH